MGRHKLKSASEYVSKKGCPHLPKTYSGIEVAAILKRRHRRRRGGEARRAFAPNAILATFPNRPDPLSFLKGV